MTAAEPPPTWTDLWAQVTEQLGNSDDARRILEQASGRSGAAWFVAMAQQAPEGAVTRVQTMIERRQAGEPLQYVLGHWGFRHLDIRVDARALIPRPETEQVAEVAIEILRPLSHSVVVDLGTGTGAIALAIATEVPGAHVYGTDVSVEALDLARSNLDALGALVAQRVRLLQGSWFDAVPPVAKGAIDLIISNPPYVAERERSEVEDVVINWEPHGALFAGPDGLDHIRVIVDQALAWLKASGRLVIELAPNQATEVAELAERAGFVDINIGTDLAGRSRWIVATKPPSV